MIIWKRRWCLWCGSYVDEGGVWEGGGSKKGDDSCVVFEEVVLRLICGYATQSGRSFYDELKCEWDMHSADDLFMFICDFNGHICRHVDGVHGGYGIGWRNFLSFGLIPKSLWQAIMEGRSANPQTQQIREKCQNNL